MRKQTETKKLKPKYPYQRVEQKQINKNNINKKGQDERKQMEKQSKQKISIGTFTFFKPKPDTKIGEFTLAFSKSLPKSEVYSCLKQTFGGNINEETVKSVIIKLKTSVPLREIREEIRKNFSKLL